MSDRPRTPLPGIPQVANLTRHRAEKNGDFRPSVYDTPYRKGERINTDDPQIAYTVRVGRVRVQKEIQAQGGRHLVTVDFLDKDAPLLIGRFVRHAIDDPDLQFYADTDVIIGEFPMSNLTELIDSRDFLASFAQVAARRIHSLRGALFGQLELYQRRLEAQKEQERTISELKAAAQKATDRVSDQLFELMELKNRMAAADAEKAELAKALQTSERRQATLRRSNEDLRRSQQALRQSHDEEMERIAKLSKERYEELKRLRDLDKRRERRRWRAIENILARLGSPLLLPHEVQDLLDTEPASQTEMPDAEMPIITFEEAEAGIDLEEILVEEDEDGGTHPETLIPPWDGSAPASALSIEQPPTSCPRPAVMPAPRPRLPTLDLGVRRPNQPSAERPPTSVGTRTAVMASIQMPTGQRATHTAAETPSVDQGRWSWPDDEPLFAPQEPRSAPISCPTPDLNPDDDTLSATTETWEVGDPAGPKPKKR
jgi:hypothetical protein